MQVILKFGSGDQRKFLMAKLIPTFSSLMGNKYSHYLASKVYFYATKEQQGAIMQSIRSSINKSILQAHSAEVIEYIYTL